jgi:SAM-dependent methyltransferase
VAFLHYRYLWHNIETAVREARQKLPSQNAVVLDIGCGHKPYADLFEGCVHIGLNNSAEDASPDLVGDACRLPIASASVDLVFCTQVLEHVPQPWLLLKECRRVLKPGGWLVLSAPFYWPLHEEPYDFFRYTRHGLERLAREAGLVDFRLRADGGDYARFCLSAIQVLPRWLDIPLRIPLNLLGLVLDRAFHRTRLPANYTISAQAPR